MSRRVNYAIRFAIAAIAGIILFCFGIKGVVTGILPSTDLYDTDWTTLKSGQHIEVYLDFVLEPFEITTDTKNNNDVSAIYTVPDLQISDTDGHIYMTHFIGVRANARDFSVYDKIVDASWKWWEDTSGSTELGDSGFKYINGSLKKMSSKERGFLESYLKDAGYTNEEINEMIIPYVLVENGSFGRNIGFVGAGALMTILFGIIAVILFMKREQ